MIIRLIRANKTKLGVAYALSITGFTLTQLYPLATGLAINGVLSGAYSAVGWLLACHVAMTSFEVAAKMYDTRVFTKIHAELSSSVVIRAHHIKLPPTLIAGRATLLREYVTFLERDIPSILLSIISLGVAIATLFWLEPVTALMCIFILLPSSVINLRLAKKSQTLSRRLNNRLERETFLLQQGGEQSISRHFKALAGWRIKLSDSEASAYGKMELFVILLFAAALFQIADQPGIEAGTIYTIFAYIWRFVTSLDSIPQIVQQVAKLADITNRLREIEHFDEAL